MVKWVLIPPLGHDQEFYAPLISLLGREHCLCLDYPYFASDFNWESDDLLEELAQYFAQKIEIPQEVSVVGVSLGATLGLRITEILATKISQLFLISSGGHQVASFRKKMILHHLETLGSDKFLQAALEVGSSADFEVSEFRRHFQQGLGEARAYWFHFTHHLWTPAKTQQGQRALLALVRASVEVNYEQLMQRLQKQLIIIWGSEDRVFSLRFYQKFRNTCPQSPCYLLAVGHFSPLETPEQIKDILLKHEKTGELPDSYL